MHRAQSPAVVLVLPNPWQDVGPLCSVKSGSCESCHPNLPVTGLALIFLSQLPEDAWMPWL